MSCKRSLETEENSIKMEFSSLLEGVKSTFVYSFANFISSCGVSGQRQVSVGRVVVFKTLLKPQISLPIE